MKKVPLVIFEKSDSLLELYPELIVHPVSCTGLSRDNLSRHLKKTWPDYFREYSRACMRKHLVVCEPLVHETAVLFGTRVIMALPIRRHWQEKLQPELTRNALAKVGTVCRDFQISSLVIPELEGPPPGWLERELEKCLGASFAEASADLSTLRVYLYTGNEAD